MSKINSSNESPSAFQVARPLSAQPTSAQSILSMTDFSPRSQQQQQQQQQQQISNINNSDNNNNTSFYSPASVQAGSLRHALNVVERLQSQLTELAATNSRLESECAESQSNLASCQAEKKNLVAKVAALENEVATAQGTLAAVRREAKQNSDMLTEELQMTRKKGLTSLEAQKALQERLNLLEKGYNEKIERSEHSVSRAMELVNRVQVAAGKAIEKERVQNSRKNRNNEDERKALEEKCRKFKRACEKLTRDNDRCKDQLKRVRSEAERDRRDLSGERSEIGALKEELVNCKVQIARHEEREKDIAGYKSEIESLSTRLSDEALEKNSLEGENAALKQEIEDTLEKYSINLSKVREVANQKIELEGEMRRRLQAEVREAKGAIKEMHKEVKDRNTLLSVLEERLGEMGAVESALEENVSRAKKVERLGSEISARPARRKGEGLYGIDKGDAGLAAVHRLCNTNKNPQKSTRARKNSDDTRRREFQTRGGTAWVIE